MCVDNSIYFGFKHLSTKAKSPVVKDGLPFKNTEDQPK